MSLAKDVMCKNVPSFHPTLLPSFYLLTLYLPTPIRRPAWSART